MESVSAGGRKHADKTTRHSDVSIQAVLMGDTEKESGLPLARLVLSGDTTNSSFRVAPENSVSGKEGFEKLRRQAQVECGEKADRYNVSVYVNLTSDRKLLDTRTTAEQDIEAQGVWLKLERESSYTKIEPAVDMRLQMKAFDSKGEFAEVIMTFSKVRRTE